MTNFSLKHVINSIRLVKKHELINEEINLEEYYFFVKRNKMRLLFLNSINEEDLNDTLYKEKQLLLKRKKNVDSLIVRISNILENNNVRYSFFKTIRPYDEVTVDVDLVLYDDFDIVMNKISEYNMTLLKHGPLSSTFRSVDLMMDVDFYRDVGVSYFIYLDNAELAHHIIKKQFDKGSIKVLSSMADILSIVSHSLIKEQLYVLSEFFTYIDYVNGMEVIELDQLITLSKRWNLHNCLSIHNSITCYIYEVAMGELTENLNYLKKNLLLCERDISIIKEGNLEFPYKYNYKSVIKVMIEKSKNPKTRRSILTQILCLFNPFFLVEFSKDLYRHLTREVY